MKTVEVWVVMDADGDYEVGTDKDAAVENFEANIADAAGARIVKVSVTMTPPKPTELAFTVPDEAGAVLEAAAE